MSDYSETGTREALEALHRLHRNSDDWHRIHQQIIKLDADCGEWRERLKEAQARVRELEGRG